MAILSLRALPVKCGRNNSFTGTLVEQASGNSRSAALAAAVQAVQAARQPAVDADQALVCPAGCEGRSNLTTVGAAGIQAVEVNPDAGTWVAQHQGHWMVELRCGLPREAGFALAGDALDVVRHEERLVCGKIRRSLGCVIAYDIRRRSLTARNRARDAARAERDRLLAEDLAKECPAGCEPAPVTRSGGRSRLVMARQVRQAGRYWVAYWIAWWWVEHKCVPVKETKGRQYRR